MQILHPYLLLGGRLGRNVRIVQDLPTEAFQPGEGGVFDDGFGQMRHVSSFKLDEVWGDTCVTPARGFSRSTAHCRGLLTM